MFRRLLSFWIIVSFSFTSIIPPQKVYAQGVLGLPEPGAMISLSAAYEPVLIKGLKINPENPLNLDFIVATGNSQLSAKDQALKSESDKLIKYFFAALTLPEKDVWVNLSPYEKDRIVPVATGETEMGRDMLAQDYVLKQITASLIYPEKGLGKDFWNKIYAEAQQRFGTTQIPVNTFNKVWIVADKASVYEAKNTVMVVDAHLKVMLEEDYMALNKHDLGAITNRPNNDTHALGSQIVREIVLPALETEVNQGKNFANLRQIFHSLILAKWYKENLKNAFLNQVYSDKNKVSGVDVEDKTIKEKIYQQYLQAYKKGVFNFIKEDIDQTTKQPTPRKYFSGGLRIFGPDSRLENATPAMLRASFAQKPGSLVDVNVAAAMNSLGKNIAASLLGQDSSAAMSTVLSFANASDIANVLGLEINDVSEAEKFAAGSRDLFVRKLAEMVNSDPDTIEADFLHGIPLETEEGLPAFSAAMTTAKFVELAKLGQTPFNASGDIELGLSGILAVDAQLREGSVIKNVQFRDHGVDADGRIHFWYDGPHQEQGAWLNPADIVSITIHSNEKPMSQKAARQHLEKVVKEGGDGSISDLSDVVAHVALLSRPKTIDDGEGTSSLLLNGIGFGWIKPLVYWWKDRLGKPLSERERDSALRLNIAVNSPVYQLTSRGLLAYVLGSKQLESKLDIGFLEGLTGVGDLGIEQLDAKLPQALDRIKDFGIKDDMRSGVDLIQKGIKNYLQRKAANKYARPELSDLGGPDGVDAYLKRFEVGAKWQGQERRFWLAVMITSIKNFWGISADQWGARSNDIAPQLNLAAQIIAEAGLGQTKNRLETTVAAALIYNPYIVVDLLAGKRISRGDAAMNATHYQLGGGNFTAKEIGEAIPKVYRRVHIDFKDPNSVLEAGTDGVHLYKVSLGENPVETELFLDILKEKDAQKVLRTVSWELKKQTTYLSLSHLGFTSKGQVLAFLDGFSGLIKAELTQRALRLMNEAGIPDALLAIQKIEGKPGDVAAAMKNADDLIRVVRSNIKGLTPVIKGVPENMIVLYRKDQETNELSAMVERMLIDTGYSGVIATEVGGHFQRVYGIIIPVTLKEESVEKILNAWLESEGRRISAEAGAEKPEGSAAMSKLPEVKTTLNLDVGTRLLTAEPVIIDNVPSPAWVRLDLTANNRKPVTIYVQVDEKAGTLKMSTDKLPDGTTPVVPDGSYPVMLTRTSKPDNKSVSIQWDGKSRTVTVNYRPNALFVNLQRSLYFPPGSNAHTVTFQGSEKTDSPILDLSSLQASTQRSITNGTLEATLDQAGGILLSAKRAEGVDEKSILNITVAAKAVAPTPAPVEPVASIAPQPQPVPLLEPVRAEVQRSLSGPTLFAGLGPNNSASPFWFNSGSRENSWSAYVRFGEERESEGGLIATIKPGVGYPTRVSQIQPVEDVIGPSLERIGQDRNYFRNGVRSVFVSKLYGLIFVVKGNQVHALITDKSPVDTQGKIIFATAQQIRKIFNIPADDSASDAFGLRITGNFSLEKDRNAEKALILHIGEVSYPFVKDRFEEVLKELGRPLPNMVTLVKAGVPSAPKFTDSKLLAPGLIRFTAGTSNDPGGFRTAHVQQIGENQLMVEILPGIDKSIDWVKPNNDVVRRSLVEQGFGFPDYFRNNVQQVITWQNGKLILVVKGNELHALVVQKRKTEEGNDRIVFATAEQIAQIFNLAKVNSIPGVPFGAHFSGEISLITADSGSNLRLRVGNDQYPYDQTGLFSALRDLATAPNRNAAMTIDEVIRYVNRYVSIRKSRQSLALFDVYVNDEVVYSNNFGDYSEQGLRQALVDTVGDKPITLDSQQGTNEIRLSAAMNQLIDPIELKDEDRIDLIPGDKDGENYSVVRDGKDVVVYRRTLGGLELIQNDEPKSPIREVKGKIGKSNGWVFLISQEAGRFSLVPANGRKFSYSYRVKKTADAFLGAVSLKQIKRGFKFDIHLNDGSVLADAIFINANTTTDGTIYYELKDGSTKPDRRLQEKSGIAFITYSSAAMTGVSITIHPRTEVQSETLINVLQRKLTIQGIKIKDVRSVSISGTRTHFEDINVKGKLDDVQVNEILKLQMSELGEDITIQIDHSKSTNVVIMAGAEETTKSAAMIVHPSALRFGSIKFYPTEKNRSTILLHGSTLETYMDNWDLDIIEEGDKLHATLRGPKGESGSVTFKDPDFWTKPKVEDKWMGVISRINKVDAVRKALIGFNDQAGKVTLEIKWRIDQEVISSGLFISPITPTDSQIWLGGMMHAIPFDAIEQIRDPQSGKVLYLATAAMAALLEAGAEKSASAAMAEFKLGQKLQYEQLQDLGGGLGSGPTLEDLNRKIGEGEKSFTFNFQEVNRTLGDCLAVAIDYLSKVKEEKTLKMPYFFLGNDDEIKRRILGEFRRVFDSSRAAGQYNFGPVTKETVGAVYGRLVQQIEADLQTAIAVAQPPAAAMAGDEKSAESAAMATAPVILINNTPYAKKQQIKSYRALLNLMIKNLRKIQRENDVSLDTSSNPWFITLVESFDGTDFTQDDLDNIAAELTTKGAYKIEWKYGLSQETRAFHLTLPRKQKPSASPDEGRAAIWEIRNNELLPILERKVSDINNDFDTDGKPKSAAMRVDQVVEQVNFFVSIRKRTSPLMLLDVRLNDEIVYASDLISFSKDNLRQELVKKVGDKEITISPNQGDNTIYLYAELGAGAEKSASAAMIKKVTTDTLGEFGVINVRTKEIYFSDDPKKPYDPKDIISVIDELEASIRDFISLLKLPNRDTHLAIFEQEVGKKLSKAEQKKAEIRDLLLKEMLKDLEKRGIPLRIVHGTKKDFYMVGKDTTIYYLTKKEVVDSTSIEELVTDWLNEVEQSINAAMKTTEAGAGEPTQSAAMSGPDKVLFWIIAICAIAGGVLKKMDTKQNAYERSYAALELNHYKTHNPNEPYLKYRVPKGGATIDFVVNQTGVKRKDLIDDNQLLEGEILQQGRPLILFDRRNEVLRIAVDGQSLEEMREFIFGKKDDTRSLIVKQGGLGFSTYFPTKGTIVLQELYLSQAEYLALMKRIDGLKKDPNGVPILPAKESAFGSIGPDQKFEPGSPTGGIDLDASKFTISKTGSGIEIKFSPAIIEQFRKGDFSGILPIITSITPIVDIYPMLGLRKQEEEERVAKV